MNQPSPILNVQNLKKTFVSGITRRKVFAVKRAHFNLYHNEVVGLVGPNGAGKTTTMKMITGLVNPDQGEISLFGTDTRHPSSRVSLGYLPENPYFYEHLSAVELLQFYGNLFGLRGKTLQTRINTLIERVGLSHAAYRKIKNYSKGMRQRVGLAQALINDPKLIILDEPQSGLDPFGRKDVRDIIYEQKEKGKTVLFSSHILPDVEAVCDRVIIMNQGKSVELNKEDWNKLLDSKSTEITLRSPQFSAQSKETPQLSADFESNLQNISHDPELVAFFRAGDLILQTNHKDALQRIIRWATTEKIEVIRVQPHEVDYETLLLEVLKEK